jgi:glycerophosphoryl diester phosphodiesterase
MKTDLPCLLLALLALTGGSLRAVDLVAHRGASHDAPENTLAAERLAWTQGADAVELDIHLSKDGQLPVLHDFNAKRITGRDAGIKDLTLAELRTLDAGGWKGPQFAGEKIPTLDEMIALLPPGRRLLVEIKPGPEIVPELARCLARHGLGEKNVTIISFNYEALQQVRQTLPHLPTLYLVGYKAPDPAKPGAGGPPTIDAVVAAAKAAHLTGLDLQHTWPLTAADVKTIKDAGLQLHVWTVDDRAIAQRWIELGAASITTNRPGWLREQLAK